MTPRALLAASACTFAISCRAPSRSAPGESLPSASARTEPIAAPPSSAGPTAPAPGFTGTWSGTYETTARRIELPPARGGLPEWKTDDGREGVGHGKLELTASADGSVVGTATGPLGDEEVRGTADGDALTARLLPKPPGLYGGTLVLQRKDDGWTGTLSASRSDGRVARTGAVTLSRSR